MILIIMGVCGCGKTTIGRLLASDLGWTFHDGDDYHPESNKSKMSNCIPLTHDDRKPWLRILSQLAQEECKNGRNAIIACSALQVSYRDILRGRIEEADSENKKPEIRFVYLRVDQESVANRLSQRRGHYFKNDSRLILGQFEALQEPDREIEKDVIIVDGTGDSAVIVRTIKESINR